MSDSTRLLQTSGTPIRKSVRRMRWFIASFKAETARISARTGVEYAIDDKALAQVFLTWIRAFEAQKPLSDHDRKRYVGFAAGLMLQVLSQFKPLKTVTMPSDADKSDPAYFWPEGYVYVAYCIGIRAAVLEQDYGEKQHTAPEMSEIRTWWSFRENVNEDSALAVAFLDLFAGGHPDWQMPGVFQAHNGEMIGHWLSDRLPPSAGDS